MKIPRRDLAVFWMLIASALLCQAIVTPFLLKEPQLYMNWLAVPIYGGLGFIGMKFFIRKTGFPGMMSGGSYQYIFPVILGVGFGILAIVFDILSSSQVPQLDFPVSVPAYVPVAILDNMFWKLFLITLIIFLISGKLMGGKNQDKVFWIASAGYALVYMLIQFGQYSSMVGEVTLYTTFQILTISGGFIITSCWVFRKFGFLAAVVMHVSQYILYHGLYGGLS